MNLGEKMRKSRNGLIVQEKAGDDKQNRCGESKTGVPQYRESNMGGGGWGVIHKIAALAKKDGDWAADGSQKRILWVDHQLPLKMLYGNEKKTLEIVVEIC